MYETSSAMGESTNIRQIKIVTARKQKSGSNCSNEQTYLKSARSGTGTNAPWEKDSNDSGDDRAEKLGKIKKGMDQESPL